MDIFFKTILELFPENPNIAHDVCLSLYSDKKFHFFSSLAGLLLKPEIVFGKLPTGVRRMNTYNSYEFALDLRKMTYSRGRLIQRYGDPALPELNRRVCESSRGSITGVLHLLGYRLIELSERYCVSRGDAYCEYEISWVNRALRMRFVAFAGLIPLVAWVDTLVFGRSWFNAFLDSAFLLTLVSSILNHLKNRASLKEAFEYQSQALEELRQSSQLVHEMNIKLMDYQKAMNELVSLAHMGEMSYDLLHDMASPTTLLSIYSQEMSSSISRDLPSRDEMIRYSSGIEKATAGLIKLQNLFRSFLRQGSVDRVATVNLNECIQSCVNLYGPYLEKRGIKLSLNVPQEPVNAELVEGLVERILLNLIQNAAKALVNHSIRELEIKLSETDDEITLRLRDTGPGIPQDRLEKLWQRFGASGAAKSGSSEKDPEQGNQIKGTGFGLYSVKKLTESMKGRISVTSSSAGTTFEIVLPRKSGAKDMPKEVA